jgi:hypothetical protein
MPNSQVAAMAAAGGASSGGGTGGDVISLGLPTDPDSTPAAAPAVTRIWIGTLRTDQGARTFWLQQSQRFPDLLKRLKLELRPVNLGAAQGVWFKVLGGPFAGTAEAQKTCSAIKSRSPADDCSVVTD